MRAYKANHWLACGFIVQVASASAVNTRARFVILIPKQRGNRQSAFTSSALACKACFSVSRGLHALTIMLTFDITLAQSGSILAIDPLFWIRRLSGEVFRLSSPTLKVEHQGSLTSVYPTWNAPVDGINEATLLQNIRKSVAFVQIQRIL